MATHLCGGHVADMAFSFGHIDLDCGMDQMAMDCANENSHTGEQFQRKGCCENQYASIESDDATTTKVVLESLQINLLIALANFDLDPFAVDSDTHYLRYSPPKLRHDLPVLFQSFLI
jgi:hypothetical protein